jgi:hypothetical protein
VATATATKGRGAKGAPKDETDEQRWEREQRDAAQERAERGQSLQLRRAGMTPQELAVEDAKTQQEATAEAARFNALTQEERNKELDDPKSPYYEPLPPWQLRLSDGRIFDAREQRPITFYATDGRALSSGDARGAREFYFEYVTGKDED